MRSFKVETIVVLFVRLYEIWMGLLRFLPSPLSSLCLHLFVVLRRWCFFQYLGYGQENRELQVVSLYVPFASPGACVAYVPKLFVKTESSFHSFPRPFLVEFLFGFTAGLDQDCCCSLSVPCACISGGCLRGSFVLVVHFCVVCTTVFWCSSLSGTGLCCYC